MGPNEKMAKQATHKLGTNMSYLGIQDATRKRRNITQRPGEWTGSISLSVKECSLFVTVSQRKWDKARSIIFEWNKRKQTTSVNYKELERDLGFFVHLAMTYQNLKPFLKGFYSTLNEWREDRDEEGWKLSNRPYQRFLELGRRSGDSSDDLNVATEEGDVNSPTSVRIVSLMRDHIQVLADMFLLTQSVVLLKRGSSRFDAMYIFGDASGLSFGSSSWISGEGKRLSYRYGIRGMSADESSSNYKSLERSRSLGELEGIEIFLFTDNSTAESVIHKGLSSSPLLYDLVVRLHKLSYTFLCAIQIIHVSGTRMISQLSRSDMLEGVFKGRDMLSFVPLHLSALDREPSLTEWVESWLVDTKYSKLKILKAEDWFLRGHDHIIGFRKNLDGVIMPSYRKGTFVWSPPPAAARIELEELRQARHKRQASLHVFLVPRLMSPEWRSQLYKTADLIFSIPAGHTHWQKSTHEPLTVAICFPYIHRTPWELKGPPIMGRMTGKLCQLFEEDSIAGRHLLSKLLKV